MKIINRTREQVIRRWVAALRSGKYKQGDKALRLGDKYCCLGVLCDLAAKDGGKQWGKPIAGSRWYYGYSSSVLQADMCKFVLSKTGNTRGAKCVESTLVYMNDTGRPFKEIADYIEETLL